MRGLSGTGTCCDPLHDFTCGVCGVRYRAIRDWVHITQTNGRLKAEICDNCRLTASASAIKQVIMEQNWKIPLEIVDSEADKFIYQHQRI